MKNPYFIDTVYYQRFTPQTLRIMERGRRTSYISPVEQFNVDLDEERPVSAHCCVTSDIFYFRPDYMDLLCGYDFGTRGHISLA